MLYITFMTRLRKKTYRNISLILNTYSALMMLLFSPHSREYPKNNTIHWMDLLCMDILQNNIYKIKSMMTRKYMFTNRRVLWPGKIYYQIEQYSDSKNIYLPKRHFYQMKRMMTRKDISTKWRVWWPGKT